MTKKKKVLTLKSNKYWAKKIRGKVHYFGTDYDLAVAEYEKQKPFLESGLIHPDAPGGATVGDLLNEFLSDRKEKLAEGLLSQRTYDDYEETCDLIVSALPPTARLADLEVDQFGLVRKALLVGKKMKRVSLKSHDRKLGYARAVFDFASVDNFLVDRPLPYRRALTGIPKLQMRKYKSERPVRILDPAEIIGVLEVAGPVLKVAVLLAINGGLNNSDVKQLTVDVATPAGGIMDYPRRKTLFKRVTPLWPETVQAIAEVIESRPKTSSDLLLISPSGISYYETKKAYPISRFFSDAMRKNKCHAAGKNFGALRTMFAEVGKEVGDDVALKAAMGHSDGSQLYESYARGVYVPRIEAITKHVREWLYG